MVNGVVDSITSKEVEFNNKGRSFRSVNLERGNIEPSQHFKDLTLTNFSLSVLSSSPLALTSLVDPSGTSLPSRLVEIQMNIKRRGECDLPDTRQDVTLQNLLQLLLVAHQLVEGVHRDLEEV